MFKSKSYKVSSPTKNDLPAALGIPKTQFMKDSSFNFLESERFHNAFERLSVVNPDIISSNKLEKTTTTGKEQDLKAENELLTQQVRTEDALTFTRTRTDNESHAPKRYTTTCYFAPQQHPVWYSETVIITLGSKKKQYFETVQYQTKLIPNRWTETAVIFMNEPKFSSEEKITVPETEYHYISLEPQQTALAAA